MNTAIAKHLFTILSSKFEIERQRLYQLVCQAEACYSIKDAQGQRELGSILQEHPYPFNIIGEYYEAFYLNHIGRVSEARKKLARVIGTAPTRYQAKGILTLSGLEEMQGNFDESMRLRLEILKFNKPPLIVESEFGIAVLLGRQGEHKHAIKLLESFLPNVRLFNNAPLYFDYLNSYAVELSEVGRLNEARNVIRAVIQSPYTSHFPNWRETVQEIEHEARRASRSVVAISKNNVQRDRSADIEISNQQTALEIYEPEIEPETNLLMFRGRKPLYTQVPHYSPIDAAGDQFTAQQKRSIIVDIVCNLDEADLERLFAFAIEIDDQPIRSRRPRQIDLESKSTLEDLMCLWANNDLDPNDYVAVLSALRDCKDSLRRQNIINEMISHIYRFTQERMQGEAMWRKRVEAKLTPEDD